LPSLAGSENRQSLVGLPGSLARKIDPSGSTSFLSRSKSWFPGLSLPKPHTGLGLRTSMLFFSS
jgi:hypothetical protein